jgi:hypothetical protein
MNVRSIGTSPYRLCGKLYHLRHTLAIGLQALAAQIGALAPRRNAADLRAAGVVQDRRCHEHFECGRRCVFFWRRMTSVFMGDRLVDPDLRRAQSLPVGRIKKRQGDSMNRVLVIAAFSLLSIAAAAAEPRFDHYVRLTPDNAAIGNFPAQ